MHRTRLALVAPLLLIGLLVGCGSDEADDDGEDRPAATATVSADADGPTVDAGTVGTDDFSFTPPDGWRDAAGEVPGFAPEVLFVEPTQGPFATNVNVIRSTGALDLSADEVVSQGFAELESVGFTGMAEGDPYEVDGETASVITATAATGTSVSRQYLVTHAGARYIITFSFGVDVPDDERVETAESLLATWRWAD